MSAVRRFAILFLTCALALSLAACGGGGDESADTARITWRPLFGDNTNDTSEVVARVGDIAITERQLEIYIEGLPDRAKKLYEGPDGERVALKTMIDAALLVRGAVDLKLYNDTDVARELIANRRNTLANAMRQYGLLRGKEPSEEEIRGYFENNRDDYRQQSLTLARHIECLTREDAEKAYARLRSGEYADRFNAVVAEMSVNAETRALHGSTGWFAKGGFVPHISGGEEFTNTFATRPIGLYEPIEIAGRWHVVEVTERQEERPMTFAEARDKVRLDMLAGWQDAVVKDYILQARGDYGVEMLGRFAPGQGATPTELFNRALAVRDPQMKIALLSMIHTDYPTSDRADDALFMAANVALEAWRDRSIARRYLEMLLEEYPDSDLREDAEFLNQNLYNPRKLNPQSIEDLKGN